MFYRKTIQELQKTVENLQKEVKDLKEKKVEGYHLNNLWRSQDEWMDALEKIKEITDNAEVYIGINKQYYMMINDCPYETLYKVQQYYIENRYKDCRERAIKEWEDK